MAGFMNVGALRRALEGIDDEMYVVVELTVEDGDVHHVGALRSVSVEHRCADEPALFLSGDDEPDDYDPFDDDDEEEDDDGDEDESE